MFSRHSEILNYGFVTIPYHSPFNPVMQHKRRGFQNLTVELLKKKEDCENRLRTIFVLDTFDHSSERARIYPASLSLSLDSRENPARSAKLAVFFCRSPGSLGHDGDPVNERRH